ncbi:MAG: CotH kinase family protein, partial [Bacteroidota bacterium]
PPAYDDIPATDHEAGLYQGGLPEAFPIETERFDQLAVEGENTLAIQIHNRFITSSDLSSNFFLSLGINDASREYEDTPDWFFEPFVFTSTNLPLIRINTFGGPIVDEPKTAANMQIVDNGGGALNFLDDPATDYNGRISIEIRGASSQLFDKKNYGFETQLANGENNNVSLLGLPEENDWILHGPYTDKSLIRNALTFQIGRDMMDYASRTVFCDLVINGDYRGVYLLMEKIKRDNNRVDIARLRPEDIAGDELTGGYIVQIDRDDPNTEEDGWYSPYGNNPFYAYHSPSQNQLMPEQRRYIRNWITDFELAMVQATFARTYEDYIDVASFIDYFLINELAKHIDAFKLSFYMYKEKDSDGGKLHMGPIWDFNLGYGNFDFDCNPNANGWIYPCTSRAFWLQKILSIGAVQDRMYCRWRGLRQGSLSNANLMNRIDSMVGVLGPAVDANFSQFDILGEYIWPNNFVGDTHAEEIVFLKNWLTQRLSWMDANMFGDPTVDCNLILDTEDFEESLVGLKVYPNPFTDQITFSLENESFREGEIFVYDMFGNLINRFGLKDLYNLNVAKLPVGMYFYEFRKGQERLQQGKVLKQ